MQVSAIRIPNELQRLVWLPLLCLSLAWAHASAGAAVEQSLPSQNVFAKVGDSVIDADTYFSVLRDSARQRFYHGNVPQDRIIALRDEVTQKLIEDVLLKQEAERRGIEPDHAGIQAELDKYDQQYAASSRWKEQREALLPRLRQQLELQSRLKRLELMVRDVTGPTEEQVRNYYRAHPEKFTTPERKRVSIILLRVPPSSNTEAWDAARIEAEQIHERLKNGADFAQLAKIHSADASAEQGGDMGYLHEGMLSSEAEQVIAGMSIDEFSKPITLLQGVAIFLLKERAEQTLNPFAKVSDRAAELLLRDMGDKAWRGLIDKLKTTTTIVINQQLLEQALK